MDESVFHRLYEEYNRDVFNFLIYLTRDRNVAEDLMHEVYVKVLKAYESFEGRSSEKTWLFAIAKNVSVDYFRRLATARKHTNEHFDWETEQLAASGSSPDQLAQLSEDKQRLLELLHSCTGDQKMVLIMRFFQDLSVAETAEALGWTESKVKTTQHRAVKALQAKMEKQPAEER